MSRFLVLATHSLIRLQGWRERTVKEEGGGSGGGGSMGMLSQKNLEY